MSIPFQTGSIRFHELEKHTGLRNRRLLKRFLPTIFTAEKRALDYLDVVFCSDQYLLQMNREYLKHNTYTDIITFDLSDDTRDRIAGEIYISVPRVRENSLLYNTSGGDETHRVLFHGILHLCGYTDKTPRQQKVMRGKEDFYLRKYRLFVSRETRST